jgi:multisubunit Na+/H+ antiporter MnhE subunit
MTETYLAWAILSIAFLFGLVVTVIKIDTMNTPLAAILFLFRCIYIALAIGAFFYAIIWALSVVTA